MLDNLRAALRAEAEGAEALAQLHGRGAVTEAETDEALHGRNTLLTPRRPTRVVENAPMRSLGIDVGGTFTDAVLVDEGEVRTAKVPTAQDQESSVLAAAAQVGAQAIERFTHGTTMATNALLERRGARTAFVTTAGFEHLLHLRRQTRAHLYRPCADHPPPLVPLERCVGVTGRMGPEGELDPLELDSLSELDAEAIAVCLLFSFRHAEQELEVAEELRRRYPRSHVVASHQISPEFREYERASTTVVDAYLGPVLSGYLSALSGACKREGLPQPLVMRSSGGLATLEEAAGHAAFALLSGPAAGAVGAARIATLAGFANALTFDMGGTSTDVCAVIGGEARREHERTVGGFPVRLPTLAVHTVGAGGGSIVWVDSGGALRVGPESAGAIPGPACYGNGGTRPTVTDADLLLGRLPPRLAGGIELDRDAAAGALGGLDPAGVVEIVDAEMVRALRVVSVDQGLDPREFALVAFGGAGPLHACALAEELGMTTVLVPAAAGVLSALGLIAADERRDSVRSYVVPLSEAGELPEEGEADLRYAGQSFELTVALGPDLADRFHAAHAGRYGYADTTRPLELVAVRTAEIRSAPRVDISGPHVVARGPQILELAGSTAWVPEGWAGETDPHGTLVLRRHE
jgi:N-methylhydantoinase A